MYFIYHKFKLLILTVFIIFSSCQKLGINCNIKPMEKIFYTIEGKPYILKSVTKNNQGISGITLIHYPTLQINLNNVVVDTISDFNIKNSKKIIPVSASLGVFDVGQNISVIDFNSPFYFVAIGTTITPSFYGTRAIAKSLPLIQRSFYTDDFHLSYKFEYEEATYSEGDFVPTNTGMVTMFTPSQAIGTTISTTGILFTANPATSYNTSLTITYFELVND